MIICIIHFLYCPDTWILRQLKISYPTTCHHKEQTPWPVDNDSDMTGVEMVSPTVVPEDTCNIMGIGDLCTSWIGQKGVGDIKKKIADEEERSGIRAKSCELRVLATECLKAFEAAGLQNSDNLQVRKAMDLCHSYTPRDCSIKPRVRSIASLWKQQPSCSGTTEQTSQSLSPRAEIGSNRD